MKALTVLLAGLFLGGLLGSDQSFGAAAADATQTVAGGGVTAKVTYLNPWSDEAPRFLVVLDTHSVNLDGYDVKSITVLRDDTGKSYQSTGAQNKGSGHHREATLTFPKMPPEAKVLELVIRDVAGVKERVFRWDLK